MSVSGAFSGGSSKSTNQSQQTSAPVINQQGLDLLMQNAQNAPGNVQNALQPYTGLLGAPLSGNQQLASSAAPGILTAGQPALNSATQAAGGLLGYQAPQIGAALASPGQMGAPALSSVSQTSPNFFSAQTGNAAQAGPAAQANAAQVNGNNLPYLSAPNGLAQLSEYMNPYRQNVVDTTMNDLNRQNQIAINGVDQRATAENAYGGDRQSVAESLTNDDYARAKAATLANLNSQGFNTAAGLLQNNQQMGLQAGGQNLNAALNVANTNAGNQQQASLANASAQNNMGQFNAGLSQDMGLANLGFGNQAAAANANAANQAGLFNAGAANSIGQFNAGATNAAGLFNAGNEQQTNLANAGALNNAGQFNVNSGLASAGVQQTAANSMANMSADQQQQFGNYINSLMATGQVDQATVQNNLTAIYNAYLQQQQAQLQGQGLLNQSVGLVPFSLGQASQGTSNGKSNAWNFGQSGSAGI